MLSLGAIVFANAWLLIALASLPVLWWLLRVTPPAPRLIRFPPIRLLFRLKQQEETPAHTPWWLLLLRLIIATLLIVGLAHPVLNPRGGLFGEGPLLLVVDNDWAAAPNWRARQESMAGLIDQAERSGRPVIVVATAANETGDPIKASKLLRPADARILVQAIRPLPWSADRRSALAAVQALDIGDAHAVWLSNGLSTDGDGEAGDDAQALMAYLAGLGSLRVLTEPALDLAQILRPPASEPGGLTVTAVRSHARGAEPIQILALAGDGRVLARRDASFAKGDATTSVQLELPAELRNRLERLSIQNEMSAGATVLLDERWRRRPVGIIAGGTPEKNQPLLSELYYLDRALGPYSELRRGRVSDLLARDLAVILYPDSAPVTDDQRAELAEWAERGGMVVRFAGPRLAASTDALLPVKLRSGDRSFGGAMSWTRPLLLAPFEAQSPFASLDVPDDVLVTRQVLAEPAADLADKTWVRLQDGTPLMTAAARGKGLIVLVHTTANTDWSNLALSGLFVDMLRRLIDLSRGVAGDAGDQMLPPVETMDGFGRLQMAPATATGLAESAFETARPGPGRPPGFYGNDTVRRALNLSATLGQPARLGPLPADAARELYDQPGEIDLQAALLAAALILTLVDLVISFGLRGLLPLATRSAAVAGLFALAFLVPDASAEQRDDAFAVSATTVTRLAYVVTGDEAVDEISRAGLHGLSRVLFRRTAVELGDPVGVDIETDELAFFPLLYWPVIKDQGSLPRPAAEKITDYLRRGGTVLFDTRDQQEFNPSGQSLRRLLRGLSIPALEPVPPEHVLTRAFYLLQRFPGRWAGGRVWVERRGQQVNDGVSPVIIGANDWAGAWAVDNVGRPIFAVVPGGEAQREQAYRFGVNAVMYALTGNYKADQVHVPTILRRLGQ